MSQENFFKNPGRDMSEKENESLKNVMEKINSKQPKEHLLYEQQIAAEWQRFQKEIPDLYEVLRNTQADIKTLREILQEEKELEKFIGIKFQTPSETYLEIRKIQPYLQNLVQHIKELESYQKTLEDLIYQQKKYN